MRKNGTDRIADLEADVELITVVLRALDLVVAALYRQRADLLAAKTRLLVEGDAPTRVARRARARGV